MKSFFYMAVGIIGLVLLVGGILVGLYMGIWWAFYGGLVTVIEASKITPIESTNIAYGITRMVFAVPIGWFCFIITSWSGYLLVSCAENKL